MTGLSPQSPTKYVGPNVYQPVVVSRNREPTGADYRQPETGKLYPVGTFWCISKDPTTGVEGDMWYLSKITANVAYWLQLSSGSSGAILEITVDAATAPGVNPVTPLLGIINFNGSAVANHSVPVETRTRALHEMNVEVQYSAASAATDATKSGLSHFKTADFSVDADGFVALSTTGAGKTITGDDAVALSPVANNWNILGRSGSKTSGSGATLTVKSPPYSDVSATATSVLNTGEFVTGAYTRTLPVSAGLQDGDLFEYVCTSASALVIQAVGAQRIRFGTLLSSAAGTLTSTAIGDSVTLRYRATDGFFYVTSSIGVWIIA